METVDQKFIDSVLEKYDNDKARIIAIMQDVQEQYRYLPQEALEYIAKKVGMSESKLYGVATFYGTLGFCLVTVQQEVARKTSTPLFPKNWASHLLRGGMLGS